MTSKAGLRAMCEPGHWTDWAGQRWRTLRCIGRIKYRTLGAHALRRYVHQRDLFACQHCSTKAIVPTDWDGSSALACDNGAWCLVLDHIISRRNGGSHHPDNLQTLCDSCNARKVATDRIAV